MKRFVGLVSQLVMLAVAIMGIDQISDIASQGIFALKLVAIALLSALTIHGAYTTAVSFIAWAIHTIQKGKR